MNQFLILIAACLLGTTEQYIRLKFHAVLSDETS